jgi:hypothetical protein
MKQSIFAVGYDALRMGTRAPHALQLFEFQAFIIYISVQIFQQEF